MAKRFETHVSAIVSRLDCSDTEKAEIAEEMYDHLMMLKDEFQKNGYPENQAINKALIVFGEEKKISNAMQDSMFPYMKFMKWGVSLFCYLLAFLFMKEGFNILESTVNVDGAGIGVHFLTFEINDHVLEKNILPYALGFFAASVMTALIPFIIFQRKIIRYIHSVWTIV